MTDIHTQTAAQVFGVPPEAVTPSQRRDARAINFGMLYGRSGGPYWNVGAYIAPIRIHSEIISAALSGFTTR